MKRIGLLLSILTFSVATLFAEAKYLFLFIGDGMGMGHVNTAEIYNRDVLCSETVMLMRQFPIAGQVTTYSASNPVTDSAAAGTALSTGSKTRNGMIGEDADSVSVSSIAAILKSQGYGIGIASSVAGDDATPASFYAHADNRGDSERISRQAATSGYDFFSAPMWRGMKKYDWEGLMRDSGYTVVRHHDFDRSKNGEKVVLLSSNPYGEQVGYSLDSEADALTLQTITEDCLAHLERVADDKFFMMVEAGNIDWASHGNDGGTVVKEVLNFQKAIAVAYEFYLRHPEETLIVVTADHDTGGMAFGRKDNERNGKLKYIDYQKISKDKFSDYCKRRLADGKNFSWEEMQSYLSDNLGFFSKIALSEKDVDELRAAFDLTFTHRQGVDEETLYNNFNQFAVKVFDMFNRELGIGWTSGNHTANFVPVYAIGAGAELFKSSIDNTDIPRLILKATGLEMK